MDILSKNIEQLYLQKQDERIEMINRALNYSISMLPIKEFRRVTGFK